MNVIGLDLSLSNTGWAIWDGSKLKYGSISTKAGLSDFDRCLHIVTEVDKVLKDNKVDEAVAEDTYLGINCAGFKLLTRLGGIFQYYWYSKTKKEMKFILAVVARKSIGVNGKATKAEIQIFIAKRFDLIKETAAKVYLDKVEKIKRERLLGITNKNKADYALKKISGEIATETGLNTDQADAILLSMAYFNIFKNKLKRKVHAKKRTSNRR